MARTGQESRALTFPGPAVRTKDGRLTGGNAEAGQAAGRDRERRVPSRAARAPRTGSCHHWRSADRRTGVARWAASYLQPRRGCPETNGAPAAATASKPVPGSRRESQQALPDVPAPVPDSSPPGASCLHQADGRLPRRHDRRGTGVGSPPGYPLPRGSRSLAAKTTAAPSIKVPQMRLTRPRPCVRIRSAALTASQPQTSRMMPSTSR